MTLQAFHEKKNTIFNDFNPRDPSQAHKKAPKSAQTAPKRKPPLTKK